MNVSEHRAYTGHITESMIQCIEVMFQYRPRRWRIVQVLELERTGHLPFNSRLGLVDHLGLLRDELLARHRVGVGPDRFRVGPDGGGGRFEGQRRIVEGNRNDGGSRRAMNKRQWRETVEDNSGQQRQATMDG